MRSSVSRRVRDSREEADRRNPIGTRYVRCLRRMVDEVRRDSRSAGTESPHVVTDKRKLDEARASADQLGNMAARSWPRNGVELAGQHQRRHRGADWNEWLRSWLRPMAAHAVQLLTVQHTRTHRQLRAKVRSIPALDSCVGREVLCRGGCQLGSKVTLKAVGIAVMHRLNH